MVAIIYDDAKYFGLQSIFLKVNKHVKSTKYRNMTVQFSYLVYILSILQ